MKNLFLLVVALCSSYTLSDAAEIYNSKLYLPPGTTLEIFRCDVDLPAEGLWQLGIQDEANSQSRLYLIPDERVREQFAGRRMASVAENKRINQGQYSVQVLVQPSLEYALEHDGIGPPSITDLDHERYSYINDTINRPAWRDLEDDIAEGPFVFLIPDVAFDFDDDQRWVAPDKRRPLAFELRPYTDDGKHWVCFTDHSCERLEINPGLPAQYKQPIRPIFPKEIAPAQPPEVFTYQLVALRQRDNREPISITLHNKQSNMDLNVEWSISTANPGDATLRDDLQKARLIAWRPWWQVSGSTVLHTWLAPSGNAGRTSRRGANAQSTSVLGVFGGRAAVRETLQMNDLRPSKGNDERTIDIASIDGVEVVSHRFDKMLKGGEADMIGLADLVPYDRFVVFVNKPETIPAFLDKGTGFFSSLGNTTAASSIDYDLKGRYLTRLGLSEQWLDLVLQSKVLNECALITPDLFFTDGTDLTIIATLKHPNLTSTLLGLAGVPGLIEGATVRRETSNGRAVLWSLHGGVLIISTSENELELILDLQANQGIGSLGSSPEFRYMLQQLPNSIRTRAYAYFSDPFIRRLVGPRTKIAQLRRLQAKAEMEQITAVALLAKADGFKRLASIEALTEGGYLRDQSFKNRYTLDPELRVYSPIFGTLTDLTTLGEIAIEGISESEADVYQTYVENYSRFWRQFFDPIAIRLDDVADGSLEATTFILPLIDNSIYNGVREIVMSRENGTDLKVPRLSNGSVLSLSLNLRESSWQAITKNVSEMTSRFTRISPAIFDDLGPGLHLAINDSEPVIALGSGDIVGAFGGNLMRMGRASEMMMIPLALSILTRPCTIAVETSDAEKTLSHLRQVASMGFLNNQRQRDEFGVSFSKISGKDSWVYSIDIMGLIKLRYGLEVKDGFLIIRNIPWSDKGNVVGATMATLNGARIDINSLAPDLLLPSLYAANTEYRAGAALTGSALLYPLLESGFATIDEAAEAHMKLFGFKPVHPEGGSWTWDGQTIISTSYGTAINQEQPTHTPGDANFGLMKNVENLSIEMQFEDSGLRSIARWKMR